jgi:hypothetical protein
MQLVIYNIEKNCEPKLHKEMSKSMYHTTANSTIHDMGFRPQTLFMELQVHKKKWSYRTLTSTYIRFISNHTTSVTKTKGKEQLHISSL